MNDIVLEFIEVCKHTTTKEWLVMGFVFASVFSLLSLSRDAYRKLKNGIDVKYK